MSADRLGGTHNLVARGIRFTKSNIFSDRAREQVCLLGDHDNGASKVLWMQRAKVDTVEADRSVRWVVEPCDEFRKCGLASTGGADQGDGLGRGDVEAKTRQHNLAVVVREGHVVELNPAERSPEVDRLGRIWHAQFFLEHARDLLERGRCRLVRVVEHRQFFGRSVELSGVEERCEQHPNREAAIGNPKSAGQQHHRECDIADEHEPRIKNPEQLDDAGVAIAIALDERPVLRFVALLGAERFDRTDAGHRLHKLHDESGGGCAGVPEQALRAHLEPPCQGEQWHERAEEYQSAHRVDRDKGDRDEQHVEPALDELADARVEKLANRIQVTGLSGDDAPRGIALVKLQRQPLRVQKDAFAQIEQNRLTHARSKHGVPGHQARADHTADEVAGDRKNERHAVAAEQRRQAVINPESDERRADHLSGRAHHDDDDRQDDPGALWAHERTKQPDRAPPNLLALDLGVVVALLALNADHRRPPGSRSRSGSAHSTRAGRRECRPR